MALILKKLYQGYFWIFDELRDPRVDDYPLMSSVWIPTSIILIYLSFVRIIGPKLMENRPPFKLDKILLVFNILQVFANIYLLIDVAPVIMKWDWRCEPIDFTLSPNGVIALKGCYIYLLLKISDLLDTVFFVLRKKQSHVSFLHIYHHSGMIALSWLGTKFLCGGHSLFLGVINCAVHAFMYFYYFLTVLKPELKSNIWWKKYITQFQLAQFVFLFVMYGQVLLRTDCKYPKVASYLVVPQNLFMMVLFSDFYYKTYIRPKKSPVAEKEEVSISSDKKRF